MEKSYQSFFPNNINDLYQINSTFPFKDNNEKNNDVIHLNGHYGYFEYGNREYKLSRLENSSFVECLSVLVENNIIFPARNLRKTYPKYDNSICYAWEMKSDKFDEALSVMDESEVLVIIGYSFPAFNREIDTKLIRAFENNKKGYKRIIYQDPLANDDIVNTLFQDPKKKLPF